MQHALLIAINRYPNLARSHQLSGCENDLELLRETLLQRFGFVPEHVTTLVNDGATRERILSALDRLAGVRAFAGHSPLREGDIVVISYSGHGSLTRDLDGDETDFQDSTLVPSDSDRPSPDGKGGPNLDITDDILFAYFEAIRQKIGRGGHLVLWFDCCRSGTIARDIAAAPPREIPPDDRPAPGPDSAMPAPRGDTARGVSGWRRLADGYVLLAGCADDEKAREMPHPVTGEPYGAMTYYLVDQIARRSGRTTYHDIFQPARTAVSLLFPTQHPQLEGDAGTLLFGAERLDVPAFVPVLARHGERTVELRAGAVQGTTVGSEYALLPPELDSRDLLATVTVSAVGSLTCRATSSVPLPPAVLPGCRAVEQRRALAEKALVVAVDGAGAPLEPLRDLIRSSPLLRLAGTEPAQVVAICHPPRTLTPARNESERGEVIFAPELGDLSEATWILVGRDLAMLPAPPHAAGEPGALERTLSNLETWARYLNVRAVRPAGADPLRPLVTANFGGASGAERATVSVLPFHTRSGLPLVRAGERVRLVLISQHDAPVFPSVLSLDATGAVTPVYPFRRGTREPLLANVPVVIDFQAQLPGPFPPQLDGGRESLKIFVTLSPVDFDILGQEGTRDTASHPALGQVDSATRGGGGAAAPIPVQTAAITPDTWTTLDVDYWLER